MDDQDADESIFALQSLGDQLNSEELIERCKLELKKYPNDYRLIQRLTVAYVKIYRYQEAAQLLQNHLMNYPDDGNSYLNLAHCLIALKRYPAAEAAARKATELMPLEVKSWINYASACYHTLNFVDGMEASNRALSLSPHDVLALNNKATLLKASGNIKDAVDLYALARDINPANHVCYTNLLLSMIYDDRYTAQDVLKEAVKFSDQFEKGVEPRLLRLRRNLNKGRRLRIGFISPDLNSHAVMYFAEPVLLRLSRQEFEIYCYYTQPAGDLVTTRIRELVDKFREIPHSRSEECSVIIEADQIDILIDLAGHTTKSGLLAMAHKPAPIQVTWLGYPGSTGMQSIDYRITDEIADPVGSEHLYTERLVRIPGCFVVYRPHIRSVLQRYSRKYDVKPPPCIRNGFITFGSCNNVAKLSNQTLRAWSKILHAVPNSRLLIEGNDITGSGGQVLLSRLLAFGVSSERIIPLQRDTRRQYLTYHDIDIVLDTFPLTGGTTTFDAIWMGVPVVSLCGRTFRERISATALVNGGMEEDVCYSEAKYIARAISLALDKDALAARRMKQRSQLERSILLNEGRFVSLFAEALRKMWIDWCDCQLASLESVKDKFEKLNSMYLYGFGVEYLETLLRTVSDDPTHPECAQSVAEHIYRRQSENPLAISVLSSEVN